MNWGGFPIGFRFPAEQITETFKRQCWETVMAAAAYSVSRDLFFHEAEVEDACTGCRYYIPAVAAHIPGPTQKNAKLWHRDARLLSHLAASRPFVQENYLELFAPSHLVGTLQPDGRIAAEAGVAFLPERLAFAEYTAKTGSALFIGATEERENIQPAFGAGMRAAAEKYPDVAFERLFYTEGTNTLCFAAAFRKAWVYPYPYRNTAGEKCILPYALLPGGDCLADGRALAKENPAALTEFLSAAESWGTKKTELLLDAGSEIQTGAGVDIIRSVPEFYRLRENAARFDRIVLGSGAENLTAYFSENICEFAEREEQTVCR